MPRLPSPWVPLVAFVLGLIGGVLLDRSIGGPGGLTVGLVVLIVPGSLAFAGPLAQQYWGNRFAVEQKNRDLFHDHATLLLNRVLWSAAQATLSYDVDNFRWSAMGRYSVNAPIDGGGNADLQTLLHWQTARPHLLANPIVRPLLDDVERRHAAGQAAKERLDQAYADAVRAAIEAKLGVKSERASPEMGWSDWSPPAIWFAEPLVRSLRQKRAKNAFALAHTSYNHMTGEPPTDVDQINLNSQLVFQVHAPSTITAEGFEEAYEMLRTDPNLRSLVDAEKARAVADAEAVRRFADAVRAYAESIEASDKHLLGECLACDHLFPR